MATMNLHQLKIFLAVAETSSFARGAEQLHLSQPTVSQHISSLEAELGLILFERSRRGASLTEAGELLKKHARGVASSMEVAHRELKRFKLRGEAPLKVGTSTIPGTYMIPGSLPAIFAANEGLKLTLVQGDSRETLERVVSGEVELGIVGSRFEIKGLDYRPLGEDSIELVVAPDHPWAKESSIPPDKLEEVSLLARETGSGTGRTIEEALRKLDVEPAGLRVATQLGSSEAQKVGVLAGGGAAFLSNRAIEKELKRGDLVTVAVEGLRVERTFFAVRLAKKTLSKAAVGLCDTLASLWSASATG